MKRVEVNEEPIVFDSLKDKIRCAVDNVYDMQKLRIAAGNRVCASFRLAVANQDEVDTDTQDKEKTAFLEKAVKECKSITNVYVEKFNARGNVEKAIKVTDGLEVIKNKVDYQLVNSYVKLREAESEALDLVVEVVKQHPMWDKFFKDAKGCGPLIAANCIAYLDIHKARHVSSFWSYVGIGTRTDTETGERVAMSRKTLIDQEYTDKDGNIAVRKSIGYNAELHTRLLGVYVPCVLKARKDNKYAEVYYDYKNRYQNRQDWLKKGKVDKIRCHRAAARQVVKAFLRDLWVVWRAYEGYTLTEPYEIEYLGNAPHKYNEYQYRMAQQNPPTV